MPPMSQPRGLFINKVEGKPGQVYYPLETRNISVPAASSLDADLVLVKVSAAALNHRDLFIRQHLYGGITFDVPLGADVCGQVVATGSSAQAKRWHGKRVIANPGDGWASDPVAPEDATGYKILGGTKLNRKGTFVTDYVAHHSELEEAPSHLSDAEASALPLAGLTAFRATHTKAREAMKPGKNVLVTGIGGGVALMALQFAAASGANVYVSSGSEEKLQKAKSLGAAGGVNYKEQGWEKKLVELLPGDRKVLDAVIDGAGGDIVEKLARVLVQGAVISVYGMTTGPKMSFPVMAVLKHVELRGVTMGSRAEFKEMVALVAAKKTKVMVSQVASAKGLTQDSIAALDELFDVMKGGRQFGKLVIDIDIDGDASQARL